MAVTASDVDTMRAMYASGVLISHIAKKFGVVHNTVRRHVDDEYRQREIARSRENKRLHRENPKPPSLRSQLKRVWSGYDDVGDVWMSPKPWTDAEARKYRVLTTQKRRPGPERDKGFRKHRNMLEGRETPVRLSPALVVIDELMRGNRKPLADYVKRIGRDWIVVPCEVYEAR